MLPFVVNVSVITLLVTNPSMCGFFKKNLPTDKAGLEVETGVVNE